MFVFDILGAVIVMIAIYKITNRLNGKPYVGQTLQHLKDKTPLGDAMRDCKPENFTLEIIKTYETQAQANERERFWIRVLNTKVPNGCNRSNGGEGHVHKERKIGAEQTLYFNA